LGAEPPRGSLATPCTNIAGVSDRDFVERIEGQQVAIAADDQIRMAG
jgi:hypothetical protein